MVEENQWVDAVAKLLELTQNGKLKWRAEPPMDSLKDSPDDRIQTVFVAQRKERRLRLYELSVKVVPKNDIYSTNYVRLSASSQEPYWSSRINLEFVDINNLKLWTFPYVSVLNDLLSAVRYQVAGVKDFLDDILKDVE